MTTPSSTTTRETPHSSPGRHHDVRPEETVGGLLHPSLSTHRGARRQRSRFSEYYPCACVNGLASWHTQGAGGKRLLASQVQASTTQGLYILSCSSGLDRSLRIKTCIIELLRALGESSEVERSQPGRGRSRAAQRAICQRSSRKEPKAWRSGRTSFSGKYRPNLKTAGKNEIPVRRPLAYPEPILDKEDRPSPRRRGHG